ncbi:MAG: hypothetical protein J3K34DRAFT_407128 [Monoraphidium minutum]|nr:MAG: hypothetical protein J3K34DRAFT_407128 [Monoraphidium minutum]
MGSRYLRRLTNDPHPTGAACSAVRARPRPAGSLRRGNTRRPAAGWVSPRPRRQWRARPRARRARSFVGPPERGPCWGARGAARRRASLTPAQASKPSKPRRLAAGAPCPGCIDTCARRAPLGAPPRGAPAARALLRPRGVRSAYSGSPAAQKRIRHALALIEGAAASPGPTCGTRARAPVLPSTQRPTRPCGASPRFHAHQISTASGGCEAHIQPPPPHAAATPEAQANLRRSAPPHPHTRQPPAAPSCAAARQAGPAPPGRHTFQCSAQLRPHLYCFYSEGGPLPFAARALRCARGLGRGLRPFKSVASPHARRVGAAAALPERPTAGGTPGGG